MVTKNIVPLTNHDEMVVVKSVWLLTLYKSGQTLVVSVSKSKPNDPIPTVVLHTGRAQKAIMPQAECNKVLQLIVKIIAHLHHRSKIGRPRSKSEKMWEAVVNSHYLGPSSRGKKSIQINVEV
jgi:hypothetical protein